MTDPRTAPAIVTGILFLTATVALPLQPAFGEGGAGRDAVRQAAETAVERAAPASLSKNATIMDLTGNILRKGTNGWVCIPDNPDTPGTDPMCMNEPWMGFRQAVKTKQKPAYTQVGIAYMLQGDRLVSNTDPFATEPKPGEDWVEGLGAHIMVLIPDQASLKNIPTDSKNGGPWVMWAGTPYAHIMIPIDSYPAQ
jgi:hypothetical protein